MDRGKAPQGFPKPVRVTSLVPGELLEERCLVAITCLLGCDRVVQVAPLVLERLTLDRSLQVVARLPAEP